jgi:CheY-like chemotaxis protein
MAPIVWVKVVGFSASERHSIQTLFRLSTSQIPSYRLWTKDAPVPASLVLVDTDCHEAEVEMASPAFNSHLKVIAIGGRSLGQAWRSFQRPVDWSAVVQVMNGLFNVQTPAQQEDGAANGKEGPLAHGVRAALLVGMTVEERLYLRARLALVGLTDVDEADTLEKVGERIESRHFDVAVVSLELADGDSWGLVQTFRDMLYPPHAVIVATSKPSWSVMEQAEQSGCKGLLEIPFNPPQVMRLFQQV